MSGAADRVKRSSCFGTPQGDVSRTNASRYPLFLRRDSARDHNEISKRVCRQTSQDVCPWNVTFSRDTTEVAFTRAQPLGDATGVGTSPALLPAAANYPCVRKLTLAEDSRTHIFAA